MTAPAFSQKPELYVQTGHSAAVLSVALSPDDKILASGSSDATVKLWDVVSGKELRTLTGHSSGVVSVTFSADGKALASGSQDRTIKLWDVASGQELKTLKGDSGFPSSVAFSPDGKTLASGSNARIIKLWDVLSGQELKAIRAPSTTVFSVAFSPDGRTLASGNGNYVVLSADGKTRSSTDQTISLWDVASGKELKTLKGHLGEVYSVAFSPDGRTLASGGTDKSIKLWDVRSGRELKALNGHSSDVSSVAFTSDGRTLASGSSDQTIKLWDVVSGQELKALQGHSGDVRSVAFTSDGRTLASGSTDKTIKLWDVASGQELKALKGHSSSVLSVAFSFDGKTLASGNGDTTIKLWDVASGQELKALKGHSNFVTSVAFSSDGKTLASGSTDKTIKLWDVVSGQELKALQGHSSIVTSVAFSSDGKTLASGDGYRDSDGTIKLWDVASGQELKTQKGHSRPVTEVVFSPDGKMLASGSYDKTIKLWDVASGQELKVLKASSFVTSVAFSSDGRTLASGHGDYSIKLWDVASGEELKTLKGHSSFVSSVAFNPDGKTLASGSSDTSIKFWNVASGQELRTLKGSSSVVRSIAFNPSGKTLASGGGDGRINLWDTNGGSNPTSLIGLDEKDWVVVTPDGRFDGSPEGLKLVSYIQDNKVFPLESFFEQFYTPKLLQRVYAREAPPATTTRVDFSKPIRMPPVVRITSPTPGSTAESDATRIVVETTDQGGGVEDIRLYQNGKLVSDDTRQLTRENTAKTKTFDVTLLPGVNTFRATAFNTDRTEATPDEIKIELKAVEASSNLYILAIGLNEYKNTRYNLNYGRADAQAFADAVEQRGRGIFKEIKKRLIFDANATRANIEAAFSEIIKQARPQDAFVFYYAGHGVMSESDSKNPADFYLVPYEVVRIYGDDGGLITNGIAARNLRELLKNVRAQKQLIVLDACESGGAVESIAMRGTSEEKAIVQLARSAGVAVFASAGQDQVATEFGKLGHGVFTYSLLRGLSGEADGAPRDGKITIKELEAYINDQVPELTKLYRGKRQDPNSWTRGQDFPIAIR